jgi:hypothetical protein
MTSTISSVEVKRFGVLPKPFIEVAVHSATVALAAHDGAIKVK